jgi:DNA-binding NarL/FixJ family response regulator
MSTISDRRTAVLLDQHPLWLDAVEQVLAQVSVNVVGKAMSVAAATSMLEELGPDLLVAETELAGDGPPDGATWFAEVRSRFPDVKVIVLSVSNDPAEISAALAAGAVAYVVKKAQPDDLAVAVRQAYEHSIFFPDMHRSPEPLLAARNGHTPDLTRRELEILKLVAEGFSNAQLARMLWVTEQTVKFHLSNIYRKLDVSNRTEASRWAQLHDLLPSHGSADIPSALSEPQETAASG